jgi:hypothetical protein
MAFLFHQNMRVFGGGTPLRTNAYANAFHSIAGALAGAGGVMVGGFTEIVNNGAAATALAGPAPGSNLLGQLGLQRAVIAACGMTVLANGPEFICIGYNGLTLLSVGRILLHVSGSAVSLIHDIAPAVPAPAAWTNIVPAAATRDYRGVVYVVVESKANEPFAVGFLHNLYTLMDQRILVAGQIPAMLAVMQSNNAMGNAAGGRGHVYLGGDFNVLPTDRLIVRIGEAFCYKIGAFAVPAGATPGGTTWSGSLYDYWYSDISPAAPPGGPTPPQPGVLTTTLDSGGTNLMSDHAATVLRVT